MDEGQFARIYEIIIAQGRESGLKIVETPSDDAASGRQRFIFRRRRLQEIADMQDGTINIVVMRENVLPAYIADELLVAKTLRIEDEAHFPSVNQSAESFGTQPEA